MLLYEFLDYKIFFLEFQFILLLIYLYILTDIKI